MNRDHLHPLSVVGSLFSFMGMIRLDHLLSLAGAILSLTALLADLKLRRQIRREDSLAEADRRRRRDRDLEEDHRQHQAHLKELEELEQRIRKRQMGGKPKEP